MAALIVSQYGNRRSSGISLHPLFTQAYPRGLGDGHGIVDALRAVEIGREIHVE